MSCSLEVLCMVGEVGLDRPGVVQSPELIPKAPQEWEGVMESACPVESVHPRFILV